MEFVSKAMYVSILVSFKTDSGFYLGSTDRQHVTWKLQVEQAWYTLSPTGF
jgi:hypothetical protein